MLKPLTLSELLCLQTVMEKHALKVSFLTQPPTVLVCCFPFFCLIYLLATFIFEQLSLYQFYYCDKMCY